MVQTFEAFNKIAREIFQSLPIQIFFLQLRRYKFVLLFWGILLFLMCGIVGKEMGGMYLFLEPEYLGKENFWSVFIVGSALGAFLFAYMITLYVYASHRFRFIGRTQNPFYTLSYNNMLLPGIFISIFIWRFLDFHIETEGGFTLNVFEKVSGLVLGIGTVFLISSLYFFAERTLLQKFGQKIQHNLEKKHKSGTSWIILGNARRSFRSAPLAESYILFPFKIKKVENVPTEELRFLIKTLSQHHGKLLLLLVLTFTLTAVLVYLEDKPVFQIPAGASFLLVMSIGLMISSLITYWFRKISFLVVALTFIIAFSYINWGLQQENHHAIGLKYNLPPAAYTMEHVNQLSNDESYKQDRTSAINTLNNWKNIQKVRYPNADKPKAVFVMASGGGLRSAYWTLDVLQNLDSLTGGAIADDMRLMTGASGGMYGLTYYRELQLRKLENEETDPSDPTYLKNISQDLLNRIFFKKFAGVFLPTGKIKIDGEQYFKDVGYSFDNQLGQNLPELARRKLGDYVLPEMEGQIPVLILTPTIINQGRKLYVSASPLSFLTRPNRISERYMSRAKGVEFRKLFASHSAENLYMTSALRMNSTFPYVLPIVELPSNPIMSVMDAGAIDNFGTQTAVKYFYEFRHWFYQNTDGVIFIQIRDTGRESIIENPEDYNFFAQLLSPIGGGYASMLEAKDMSNDYLLEFIQEWYRGYVEVISFEYPRETTDKPASLSWHLTEKEKQHIRQSIFTEHNQHGLETIKYLYNKELLADIREIENP